MQTELNTTTHQAGTILAIDIGNICGFAFGGYTAMISGACNYKTLESRLDDLREALPIDAIYCTSSGASNTAKARHLEWVAARRGIAFKYESQFGVRTSFTGRRKAPIDEMVDECERRGFEPIHDKEAGAIALFDLVLQS